VTVAQQFTSNAGRVGAGFRIGKIHVGQMAALNNGQFVMSTSYFEAFSGSSVYAYRYKAGRQLASYPVSYDTGSAINDAIASYNGGSKFVVVWEDYLDGEDALYGQRYSP
jgi:hypothetical protein